MQAAAESSDTISIEVVLHLALGPFAVPKKVISRCALPGQSSLTLAQHIAQFVGQITDH